MKRKIFLLAAATAAAAGLLSACGGSSVATQHPVIGDIQETVEESGTVYYADNYAIASTVGGRITSCGFDTGDRVEQGAVLYTIDDTDIANQITNAQIGLDTANAAYAQAAKAADDLSVKSYVAGMVTQVYCNTGDYVVTGSKVAQVVDSTHLKLKLAYADAGNIHVGSAAGITVTGEGTVFNGTVTKVYDQNTVFSGHQTGVYVEISFANPGALISGEGATATINGIPPVASGTIEYATDASVYSTGTGLVTSVSAGAGSSVSPGSVVLHIKNDAVTAAVTNAQLGTDNAQATLKQLQEQLDHYTVKAPVGGTILSRIAKVSDLASPGVTLATLSSGDTVDVQVDIDEKYIAEVAVGQTATITLSSGTNDTAYTGVVREISDSGTVTNGVTYYTVKIALDRQEGLMDGMNVDVFILTASKKNCLLVPKACVINGSQVEVLENGKTVTRDVVTGITDGTNVEVVSGLSETDNLITK